MNNRGTLWPMILGCGMALVAATALAQSAPPRGAPRGPRVTGTVMAMHGHRLMVKTLNGTVAVMVMPKTRIVERTPASLSDVTSGKFIGTTAVQKADGKLYSTEIHIFPNSMRGAGEGHYPMGPPKTTMTNGNVQSVAGSVQAGANPETLSIAYKGGVSQVVVGPHVPVTMFHVGTPAMLRPGTHVTVLARSAHRPLEAAAVILGAQAAD